jgi:hypothetical protein
VAEASDSWRVELIDRERQAAALRHWVEEAIRLGLGVRFAAAYSRIVEQLQTEPENFGDPLYNAQAAGCVCYHRLEAPLQVWYAVHPVARVVWIQRIRPQDGLGFSEP